MEARPLAPPAGAPGAAGALGEAHLRHPVRGAAAGAGRGRGAGATTGSVVVTAGAASTTVRLGRASLAERTRLGADVKRLAAFLPPVVRALRRSSAASRLDVLAMTARQINVRRICSTALSPCWQTKRTGSRFCRDHKTFELSETLMNQRPSNTTKQAPWLWV